MRTVGQTFVPPTRSQGSFGVSAVRNYTLDGGTRLVTDPVTRVTADPDDVLDGDLDLFMRARLAL